MREWWIRQFNCEASADIERCSCCGKTYYTRDLKQVLPHFEHQLGLGVEAVTGALSNESLSSFGNVVPFRRASKPTARRRIDMPSHRRG
jgi:hypothetical protein